MHDELSDEIVEMADVKSILHEFAIVANIPASFHSADLRNYFSQFIEASGFSCFHFRHRPETKILEKESDVRPADPANSSGEASSSVPGVTAGSENIGHTCSPGHSHALELENSSNNANVNDPDVSSIKPKTFCCVVKLEKQKMSKLLRMYHRKPWIDKKGAIMSSRCFISRIRVENTRSLDQDKEYTTRGESKLIPPERETFTELHLTNLAELNPPDLMPSGNVGTPTSVFLEYIRTCRLPPRVIQKLGLTFSKSRTNRRYGNVQFSYGGETLEGQSEKDEIAVTASGHDIVDESYKYTVPGKSGASIGAREKKEKMTDQGNAGVGSEKEEQESESDEDDDDDTCEEWERHESLHEDITSQGRTKERLFEENIELKWEKGGSGLVFYTDAAFWDAQEGDFDEKTSDDWDVDMSIYYDEYGGDKDARDSVAMRKMDRMKRGLDDTSVFDHSDKIGKFEKHTKGIGRKVLQKQGWTEGQGLGKKEEGMADALDNTGQNARDKTGFGYHGEKLQRNESRGGGGGGGKRISRRGGGKGRRVADKQVIISTIYDDPSETDPQEPLMRSRGPHHLKYRHVIEFVKGDRR